MLKRDLQNYSKKGDKNDERPPKTLKKAKHECSDRFNKICFM